MFRSGSSIIPVSYTHLEILDVEQKALITGTFKEISINDMHIIDAIGIGEPKNMSTVAGEMAVTVGTLRCV